MIIFVDEPGLVLNGPKKGVNVLAKAHAECKLELWKIKTTKNGPVVSLFNIYFTITVS
jgi:hypothetical protein